VVCLRWEGNLVCYLCRTAWWHRRSSPVDTSHIGIPRCDRGIWDTRRSPGHSCPARCSRCCYDTYNVHTCRPAPAGCRSSSPHTGHSSHLEQPQSTTLSKSDHIAACRQICNRRYGNSNTIRDHSVTCHPAEVTFPPLPQPKLVLDLVTMEGCMAELT